MGISNKLRTFWGVVVMMGLVLLLAVACGSVTPAPPPTRTSTLILRPTISPTAPPTHDQHYPKLKKLAIFGKGVLPDILRSPDGKLIATTDGGDVHILQASDWSEIATIPLSRNERKLLHSSLDAISPDGRSIIVSRGFGGISVFDIGTQKELASLKSVYGGIIGSVFLPDSRSIVYRYLAGNSGGVYHSICMLKVPETAPASPESQVGDCFDFQHSDRSNSFTNPAVSPDGSLVAAGHWSQSQNVLYIWDTHKQSIRFKLAEQPAEITSVSFSPDGRWLASAGLDGIVRLWDPATGALKRTITSFLDNIDKVAFTPNGRGLIIKVADRPAVVYDLASGAQSPPPSPTLDPLAVKMLNEDYMLGGGGSKMIFSPNGKNIAVGHGSIQIWDAQTQKLLQTLIPDQPLSLLGMAYSQNGEHLGVVNEDGSVLSWNLVTSQQELSLTAVALDANQPLLPTGQAEFTSGIGAGVRGERSIAFSPDGNMLALGNGLTVDVWDIATASKLRTLEQTQPAAYPTAVSFSEDGRFIYAVLNRNRDAAIWDAATGKLVRRRNLPSVDFNAFTAIALHGSMFARNNYENNSYWIEIWDLARGKLTKLVTPIREIEPLRFSANGKFFAALVNHQQIYVWRLDTMQLILITENASDIGDLAISSDGDLLATAEFGQVSLWELGTHTKAALAANFTPLVMPPTETPYPPFTEDPPPTQVVQPLSLPKLVDGAITVENAAKLRLAGRFGNGHVSRVVWDRSGILVTASDGVHQFEPTTLKETSHFPLDGASAGQGRILPDGQLLVAGAMHNGKIQLWDAQKNMVLAELPGAGEPDISADGKWLVFPRESGGLITWNIETNQASALLRSYGRDLSWPSFSPDGKRVAAIVQYDHSIRIWDTVTGVIIGGVGGPPVEISKLSFSPDGSYIVAIAGSSVWAWNIQPGASAVKIPLSEGKDGESLVSAVAMDQTNTKVAVGSSDHTIWLYDRKSAKVLGQLTGDSSAPIALAFSPDNTQLLSLYADGQMIVWDLAAREPLLTSHHLQTSVSGFTIRRDGRLAVWGKNTLWTLNSGDVGLKSITYVPGEKILSVSPMGELVAGYSPFQVSLYDAATGLLKQTLPDQAKKIEPAYYWQSEIPREFLGATFDHDGKQLATFGTGGLWLYSLPNGAKISNVSTDEILEAYFSTDHDWLLADVLDPYSIRTCPSIYQVKDAGELLTTCLMGSLSQISLSPDKRWVGGVREAWTDERPSVLLIGDTSTGQIVKQLNFGNVDAHSLAFNPDVSLVAVGQKGGKIALVDFATMKVVTTLPAHADAVASLAFSADGRSLFSLGQDGVLKIWTLP